MIDFVQLPAIGKWVVRTMAEIQNSSCHSDGRVIGTTENVPLYWRGPIGGFEKGMWEHWTFGKDFAVKFDSEEQARSSYLVAALEAS